MILQADSSEGCSLREELEVSPHLSSALLLLLLPIVLGLIPVTILSALLNLIKPGWNPERTVSDLETFFCNPSSAQKGTRRLARLMTIISTLFYSVNMVVAELLFDQISIAAFVFLKHILPYFANIAVPLLVIITQDDIRSEAMVGWTSKWDKQLMLFCRQCLRDPQWAATWRR